MESRERVVAAIHHRQPDRVPFHVTFTREAHRKVAEHLGDAHFDRGIRNDLAVLSIRRKVGYREIRRDIREDEFGVQYNQEVDKDIGVVCNRVIHSTNVQTYRFPDPGNPLRYTGVKEFVEENGQRFTVINQGFSLFERAWSLAGMEQLLMDMAGNPGFVETLLDRILAYNLGIIHGYCGFGIDAMMFGDDWAHQRGLLMGPALWRKFLRPRLARMYEAVKSRGKYVVIHSCGRIDEILPDLIEMGVDVINPFQPEAMDIYGLKKRYGGEVTFYGGIGTQHTLSFGTRRETTDEVKRLLRSIGSGGGYIAAPAHAIPPGAEPQNVIAMIEALERQ